MTKIARLTAPCKNGSAPGEKIGGRLSAREPAEYDSRVEGRPDYDEMPSLTQASKKGSAAKASGIATKNCAKTGRLKPRKPDPYDSREVLQTDLEDLPPGVEIVKVVDGRPMVQFVGTQPLEEELEQSQRKWEKYWEDQETIGVLRREDKERREEQADIEEANRIEKDGTLDQKLRLYDKQHRKHEKETRDRRLGETMSKAADEADEAADTDNDSDDGYGGDTRRVVADQDNDHRPDIDDSWQYEGFTKHQFWEATHPPMFKPGDKRAKYPPIDKQTVPMPRWLYRVTKVWAARSMLALLVYYFQLSRRDEKIRARRRIGGHVWVAKPDTEMAFETGLTPRTVKDLRERLIKKGLIIVEHHRFPVMTAQGPVMLRVCHYRLNWNALEKAYLDGGGDYEYLEDEEVAGTVARVVKKKYGKKIQVEVGGSHGLDYYRDRENDEEE